MKTFTTAVKEKKDKPGGGEPLEIEVDGDVWRFIPPAEGQIVIMMALGGRSMGEKEFVTFLNLFTGLADENTAKAIESRLLDRNDDFDMDEIFGLWKVITEEWSARPTKSPSGSRSSRRATGTASTAPTRVKASTSSTSRTRASSQ